MSKRIKSLVIGALLVNCLIVTAAQNPAEILVTDAKLGNYIVIEREVVATRQGMFDYMDGGAELYFDHGWDLLVAADLEDTSTNELKVEIYSVKTPQNALDLLETQDQLGDTVEIGDKSYYGSGMIVWAQNNYYIRLWAWDEYDSVKDDVIAIAHVISEHLGE
jgi:hypothetical protein